LRDNTWLTAVEKVVDRYIFIENGEIVAEGTLTTLRNTFRAPERQLKKIFTTAFDE
jgi:ABC-type multidrug transport system ATPase subunit